MDCRVQYQFEHSRQRFCYWIYKRCISSMNDECGSHCSEYKHWTIAVYVFHFNFSFLVPYQPRCKILIIHKSHRPWVWVCGTLALLIRDRFFLAVYLYIDYIGSDTRQTTMRSRLYSFILAHRFVVASVDVFFISIDCAMCYLASKINEMAMANDINIPIECVIDAKF